MIDIQKGKISYAYEFCKSKTSALLGSLAYLSVLRLLRPI